MASLRSIFSYVRRAPRERRLTRPALHAIATAVLLSACGHGGDVASNAAAEPAAQMPSARTALCIPADEGRLRARLSGDIDAEIDWTLPTPQCLGGQRPDGEGVRLIYKGDIPGQGPLLLVIGIGPLAAGASADTVPANLTLVLEGAGRFYATQGDDKCAVEHLKQEPVGGDGHTFRLTGRGYCTQPARAVGADGSVLVPRFDVSAVVDYK